MLLLFCACYNTDITSRILAMYKYALVIIGLVWVLGASSAHAQSANLDALLLRIDKLILEMQLIKKEVESVRGGTSTVGGGQTTSSLTQSLEYGVTNSDISRIQKLLATDSEIYPYGVDSGFFGPKTEEAIKNLQARHGLDSVGAIGPSTRLLLEGYFAMYPSGNYPADVLKKKPQVSNISNPVPAKPSVPAPTTSLENPFSKIVIRPDHGEADVTVTFRSGTVKTIVADGYTDNELMQSTAKILKTSLAYVKEVATVTGSSSKDDDDDDADYDKGDAEDAIEDADKALEDAEDAIDDAAVDGEDVDDAEDLLDEAADLLDEAEDALDDRDYDKAVSKAKKAKKVAEEAEDEVGGSGGGNAKGDVDDITSIEAEVDEDESEVTVEYENDDDYTFTIDEDKVDEIIEAIAEKLDLDEDDVEDLIEFNFGDIDSIMVYVSDGKARVEVEYESGVSRRIMLSEDDEDSLIEEIADELEVDEDDVEDVVEFEYDN